MVLDLHFVKLLVLKYSIRRQKNVLGDHFLWDIKNMYGLGLGYGP
jgi:hypothetical protein